MPRPTLYERMRSANRLPTAPSPPPPISTPHNPVRSGSLIRPYQPPTRTALPQRAAIKPHPSQTHHVPVAPVEVPPPGGWLTNQTIPMRAREKADGSVWDWEPGEFYIGICTMEGVEYHTLGCCLPGKREKSWGSIIIIPPGGAIPPRTPDRNGTLRPAVWQWDGNRERPTLSPSIRHGDASDDYYWHGYAKAGVLEGCAEKLK